MALPTRREREKENRRREVLRTGLSLFSERGYANVTMDQIALKAELTKPTLYQYFDNKADLYSTIILELGFDFVESSLKSCLRPEGNPPEEFARIRATFRELCLGAPRKIFLLYLSLSHEEIAREIPETTLKKMRARLRSCLGVVEDVFERGVAQKQFTPLNPTEATQALWAMCIGLAQMHESNILTGRPGSTIPALYDTVLDTFFDSIRRPHARKSN